MQKKQFSQPFRGEKKILIKQFCGIHIVRNGVLSFARPSTSQSLKCVVCYVLLVRGYGIAINSSELVDVVDELEECDNDAARTSTPPVAGAISKEKIFSFFLSFVTRM